MNTTYLRSLLLVLLSGVTWSVAAQSNTIRIDNGRVFINGIEQRGDALPGNLHLEGITASLSFSGATRFRLGDQAFYVDEGQLHTVEPTENDFVVFMGRGGNAVFTTVEGPYDVLRNQFKTSKDGTVRAYYEILDGQIREMDKLHAEFGLTRSAPLAERLSQEAEQAARMVAAFPRVEMQTYLEDLEGRNKGLYDGILREHLMEMETRRLATQIQATSDNRKRSELLADLEDRLRVIFELKQENRRAEIEQLDARLTELRGQLDARERHRKDIIDRRVRELLGELK